MNRSVLVLPLVLMFNFIYTDPHDSCAEYGFQRQQADHDAGLGYASAQVSDCAEMGDCHRGARGKGSHNTKRPRCHDSFCPLADAWLYEDLPMALHQQQYDYEEQARPHSPYEHEQSSRPQPQYDHQIYSSHPIYIQRQEQGEFVEQSLERPTEIQIVPKAVAREKQPIHLNGVFGFTQNPKLRICRPLFTPSTRNEPNDIAEQTISCFFENADVEIKRGTGWSLSNAHIKDMHVVRWEFMPGLGMLRCSIDCIVTVKFDQELKEPPSVIIGVEATDYDQRSSAAIPICEFDQAIVWVPDNLRVCPVEVTAHGFKAKCTLSAQGAYDVRVLYDTDDAAVRKVDQFPTLKKADFRESLQWLFNSIIMGHSLSFTLSGDV